MREKINKKSKFWTEGVVGTLLNVSIIVLGFVCALGLFIAYRNYETQKDRESLIPRAKEAYHKGEFSQAINIFSTAEKEFPDNIEVKEYLGDLFYSKGKYSETVKYLESVKSAKELSPSQLSALGNSYIKQDRKDDVIKIWEKKDLNPRDSYSLAQVYLDKGDTQGYFWTLNKIISYKEPLIYSQVLETNLSNILNNIEKASAAESLSSDTINIDLFKAQINEAKKQADYNKKDYSELIQLSAFANLKQCKFIDTRIKNLKSSLESQKIPLYQVEFLDAKCANQNNQPDTAIPLINKAINSESTNLDYREELAQSYFLKNDIENVKKTYADIFVISKDADLYSNYAALLYKLDQKADSIINYKDAFKITESNSQKSSLAFTITQIEFLDNRNLEICSEEGIVSALDYSNSEEYLIRSICDIQQKRETKAYTANSLYTDFINALKNKDTISIDKILDKDTEGYLSSYYNAVGVKLI